MTLARISIVLVRPEEAGNVGAVCRAMKNCGLSRLRLVSCPELSEDTVRARAVHADDVWRSAERFASLEEAVADCGVVIGATRRRGHKRKGVTMPPDTLAAFLKSRPQDAAAILFGNERAGLEDRELNLCSFASHIPASDAFPSFNLSHAVQIYAYELFKAFASPQPVTGEWTPLAQTEIGALARSITDSLADLGFYKQRGREEQERFLRDVFSRAGLSEREGRYMEGIFVKAARLAARLSRPHAASSNITTDTL